MTGERKTELDAAWERALDSACRQFDIYWLQDKLTTHHGRRLALADALEHAIGILRLHEAALPQSALSSRLVEAVDALYYAAYWHPDREVDAAGLWQRVRDAAGLPCGQTFARLGPDRSAAIKERK